MSKLKLYLILIVIGLFSSCTKEEQPLLFSFNECVENCITINGEVFNPSNKKGIEGVQIKLIYSEPMGMGSKETQVGIIESNINGKYNLSFSADSTDFQNGSFLVYLEKEMFLQKRLFFNSYNITFDTTYNLTTFLLPQSELKLKIKNINPFDENDILDFSLDYRYEKYIEYNNVCEFELTSSGSGVFRSVKGTDVDLEESYLLPSDESINIGYSVTKNNNKTSFNESIQLENGKISEYTIEY